MAWKKFQGMYADFAKRGCAPGTDVKTLMPSITSASKLPLLDDTEVYDINGNIYIAITEEDPDIVGFATVYDFRLRPDANAQPFFPENFAYIAHFSALPKHGRRLHQVLRQYFGKTPFLIELEQNPWSLASKVYMPYGFRPCVSLDPACDWAHFMRFVLPRDSGENPTKRASVEGPIVYGNIVLWMIELPGKNRGGRIDEKLVPAALRSMEVVEKIGKHGPGLVGLLAQYTNDVISWVTSRTTRGVRRGRSRLTGDADEE